jgi:hypothetical protein
VTAPATGGYGGCGCGGGDSCGGGCDSCGGCDSGCHRESLFGRLRGMFHRNRSCCEESCCEAAPCCSAPAPCCAQAQSCCDSGCDSGCGCQRESLFGRLRGMFHRRRSCCESSCCESGCDSCGSSCGGCANGSCGGGGGAVIQTAPKTEQIQPPANNKKEDPGQKMPTGVEPPLKPVGLEAAPAVTPKVTVEADKSPF